MNQSTSIPYPKDHQKTSSSPQGPPLDDLPPLKSVELPLILPKHRYNLADQGWSTVTFEENNEIYQSLQLLFAASKTFFDQPLEEKQKFLSKRGTEEGWSRIEGEKEFITIRQLSFTPDVLKEPASAVWLNVGKLLNEMLVVIAESLELPPNTFTVFSEPCTKLDNERRGTMMRLFRYENHEPKVVAEPHNDLGLLSLVIGETPGLETWNKYTQSFFPIERSYSGPAASVLVGRQLQRFSNNRYVPGGHLVRSYPDYKDRKYRFSIVFVLRAHWPVVIDTDKMTSRITGSHAKPIKGETALAFFSQIRKAHYNINSGLKERDKQKQKLIDAKGG
jgi:isopenicillin N synthase-like dioxygenase